MKENSFTFVVPRRETESIDKTISAIKRSCEKLQLNYEIFSVCGNNPTKQRNECISLAKNSYIYFLDNDSILDENPLVELKDLLTKNPDIAIAGGPSLTPVTDSYLQKNFGAVLSSFSAVGKISARYSRKGNIRETDDSELILCNLIVKKDIFDKYGKFNENLYPNEENEFIYRVKKIGGKAVYDPDIYIYRTQRRTLKDFIKQMFTYGRGRGEQTRLSPKSFNPGILIPVIFSLYILFLLPVANIILSGDIKKYLFAPLLVYVIIVIMSWINKLKEDRIVYIYYPVLFLLTHLVYSTGIFYGFSEKGFKADKTEFYCKIEKV